MRFDRLKSAFPSEFAEKNTKIHYFIYMYRHSAVALPVAVGVGGLREASAPDPPNR